MTGKTASVSTFFGRTLFGVILLCFLCVLFIRVRLIFVYTPNVGGIEQNVIFSLQTLASGGKLYTDPEKPLYSVTQYSPLYFHLVASVGRVTGLDPDEPAHWYQLSRIVSLIFNLLTIAVAFRILKRINPGWQMFNLALSLLLFIFFEQQDYSRPDSLYHLFFALTVLYSYRYILQYKPHFSLAMAGMFLSLALFSKQNAVLLLAFICCCLLLSRQHRRDLLWFVPPFLALSVLLCFIFLRFPATIIIKNLYLSILNGFDLRWAIRMYFLVALPRFILFFLTITLMVLHWKEMKSLLARITVVAALFYLSVALFSGLKWGSGTNYFFEFTFFALTGISLLLQHALDEGYSARLLEKISIALLITMVIPQLLIIAWRDYYKNEARAYYAARETVKTIEKQEWYNSDTRFVVPDRNWIQAFLYKKALFAQPDIYRTLWNPDPAKSKLHPQKYQAGEVVLIRSNAEPFNNYFNILLKDYVPVMQMDNYQVLRHPAN